MPVRKSKPTPKPKPKPQPAAPPAATITPGEMRIEIQLEGVRSILSSAFLALGDSHRRMEQHFNKALGMLDRIATAIEEQTKLLTRSNGYAEGTRPSID